MVIQFLMDQLKLNNQYVKHILPKITNYKYLYLKLDQRCIFNKWRFCCIILHD
jgi:hypothetical protein